MEKDRYCMELAAAYFGIEQYDVIHTQDVIATRALSRVKRKDSALVANIHGSLAREVMMALERDQEPGYRESLMWKYYWALEHYGAISADITITSTEWMKQTLVREFEVPEQQLATFQYGLDTEHFWEIEENVTDMTRPVGKKVIICPSRLVYIKRLHYLMSALGLLKDAVFSLGGHGLPSIHLDKNGLRPYAGPLDWMRCGAVCWQTSGCTSEHLEGMS
ncbi:glycosyltransferase [Paenibacillus sp. NPDC055715]